MPRPLPMAALLSSLPFAALVGCSSGSVQVSVEVGPLVPGARLTLFSEGHNTFSALGESCEAAGGGSCALVLPPRALQGGWNTLTLETERRTDEPITVTFHVGEELFPRDCTTTPSQLSADPAAMVYEVLCRFPDGFSGELAGVPLQDGRGQIRASECLGDVQTLAVDLTRPLLRGAIPLVVVNEAGGRLPRPIPVAVPAPLVQLSLEEWAPVWFEERMPLRLKVESGATVLVNGSPVDAGDGGAVTVQLPIEHGANLITVEARKAGLAPALHRLAVEGRYPDTPLHLDQSFPGLFTTDKSTLHLSGRTLPAAKLYVNSRPLDHARGRFSTEVYLEEGKNEVQVLAVLERRGDQEPRPLTRIDIEVVREGTRDPRLVAALAKMKASPQLVALADVAADPWENLDQTLRFPMTIDEIVENPSMDGSCSARMQGRACTERVGGDVMLGWGLWRGWTCVGDEVPVLVEVSRCPDATEGDDVEVVGVVQGALGGRVQGATVDRPRIDGLRVERLPTREELPPDRWPARPPRLLAEGRR